MGIAWLSLIDFSQLNAAAQKVLKENSDPSNLPVSLAVKAILGLVIFLFFKSTILFLIRVSLLLFICFSSYSLLNQYEVFKSSEKKPLMFGLFGLYVVYFISFLLYTISLCYIFFFF